MIKAILFDIDGTLIDSNRLHVAAWGEVFADAGHAIDPETIAGQIGKGGDNLVPALLPDLDADAVEALGEAHGTLFKTRYLDQARPFPDARALIERAHRDGRQIVLASSASGAEIAHYIGVLGVEGLIAATTSSDDVGTTKPAPDIFAVALEKTGLSKDEAIAVGDTPYDATAAAKAGMGTVGLLSGGFTEEALRGGGAGTVYADVAALLAGYAESPLAR